MSLRSKYWYLSQFNLSQRLSRKDFKYFCDNSLMKRYKRSSVLVYEYDDQQHIYFLKKGTLQLTRINAQGEALQSDLISRGSIFGLTQLLVDDYPGNEQIVAVQDSLICKVEISLFKGLMERNKALNNHILKLVGLKITKLENHLEDVLYKTAQERIRAFIENFVIEYGVNKGPFYQADLFLTNKDIAKLTNTNRQKVSGVMNAMRREKLIDYDRKTIKYFNG